MTTTQPSHLSHGVEAPNHLIPQSEKRKAGSVANPKANMLNAPNQGFGWINAILRPPNTSPQGNNPLLMPKKKYPIGPSFAPM